MEKIENALFAVGDLVKLRMSDESGRVIARAEYETSERGYLVRYRAGDGRAVEAWWSENALEPARG